MANEGQGEAWARHTGPWQRILSDKHLKRPDKFDGTDEKYREWAKDLKVLIEWNHPNIVKLMEWAEGRKDKEARMVDILNYTIHTFTEDMSESIVDLHKVLKSYTTAMVLELVENSDNGVDAWRKIAHMFEPRTVYNQQHLLDLLQGPARASRIEELGLNIEKWENDERRYMRLSG